MRQLSPRTHAPRTHAPRAAGLLIAMAFVLAGPAMLVVDRASGAAANQPVRASLQLAQVGDRTAARPDLGSTPGVTVPTAFAAYPDNADGWRSGSFPRVVVAPPEAIVASLPKQPVATTLTTTTTTATVWWKRYSGTNHVWMPTLGINRHVYPYPCSRTTDPNNVVYRWGCGGTNNTYLLGHSFGVFRALHDAYYNGKLKKGMPVVYADGSGRERLYRVTTWKVVSPVDSAWAIASQSRPSMTLQTCIGSRRLVVRLVIADR